MYHSDKYTAKY